MKTYQLYTYLFTLALATLQASQVFDKDLKNNNTNLKPEKKDLELQQGIEKYLPPFFQNNQQMLEKLEEGNRQAVVVIGQTGAGKSTLIGALLGQEFALETQEVKKIVSGGKRTRKRAFLVNKSNNAPKIGHSTTTSETIFPQTYLDKENELAFIDTTGLADTRKDGKAINLCNALGLHSLIQKIGGVKCIIGVIEYELFKAGKGSNTFANLLNVTSGMLKNKSPEALTSSMVLAFTKVPGNVTNQDINEAFEDRCDDLMRKKENKQMREEDKVAEAMYKTLFPSFYGLENKKDVPFFLISQESLLEQGLVRKNILPILQGATQVDSRDIGLVLHPYLLQKTKEWLAKRAQSVADYIKKKQHIENKISHGKQNIVLNQQQLSNKQNLLKQLIDPNNQDKKDTFKKCLEETIENNIQRIQGLDLAIKNYQQEQNDTAKAISTFNTNEVIFHSRISGSYDKDTKKYTYSYNSEKVPINHIIYNDHTNTHYNTKDPKPGDRISDNYKIVAMTKNYDEGILYITLENNISGGLLAMAAAGTVASFGITGLAFAPLLTAMKWSSPDHFYIYAKKKHIYHSHINTLIEDIKELDKTCCSIKYNKNYLEKEIQRSRYYLQQLQSNNLTQNQLKNNGFDNQKLQQVASNLLQEKLMIEKIQKSIKHNKQVIERIESDLQTLYFLLNLLNKDIVKNAIMLYIITHLAPFIPFHDCHQHNLNICKQYYMNNLKQHGDQNNINTNEKHSDIQPGEEREKRKEDNDCDNNNNSSLLTSSTLLGTSLLASSLSRKKN